MAKVLSSISGNLISAASAGYAPTNGADVSAIASAYQVVSATGTQTYAGTAYVTSLNSAPVSAERAGNAANAAMANSAWYDGTGRYISALPDSAAVSSIASAYVSGKQDSSAMSAYALSADVSGCIDTVSSNSASWASSIATASATAYKQNGTQLVTFTGVASADSKPLIAQTIQAGAVQNIGQSNFFYGPSAKPFTANTAGIYSPLQYATGACLAMDGGTYRAYYKGNEWFVSDYSNSRSGAVRAEVHSTRGIHISGSNTAGVGFDLLTTGLNFTNNTGTTSMTPANIAEWQSCNSTVSANSANWGGPAVSLSAGPGIILYKTGDTLVAGIDETVLWEGSARLTSFSSNLSESLHNFKYVDIYVQPNSADVTKRGNQVKRFEVVNSGEAAELYFPRSESMENYNAISEVFYVWNYNNGEDFTLKNGARWSGNNYVSSITAYRGMVTKIVGVSRI